MAEAITDVFVGGYRDVESPQTEFDALIALVKAKKVAIEAAIVVTHSLEGEVNVVSTGDCLGRQGAGWGGAAG